MTLPLERTWVGTGGNGLSFSLLTWNTLADGLAHGSFLATPPEALEWSERKARLLEGLLPPTIGWPDVICLQEVDHYRDFFEPALEEHGYVGAFAPKAMGRDGCALFVRDKRFVLVDQRVVRFHDDRGEQENQLALLADLQCKQSGARVRIATTHLKAKPGFEEQRGRQAQQLLAEVGGKGACVIAGDFNDVPGSPAHAVFASDTSGFGDVYADNGAPAEWTTWKIREAGEVRRTIDYVWYRRGPLRPLATLSIPPVEAVGPARLPSWQYPSDHLSLGAVFAFQEA